MNSVFLDTNFFLDIFDIKRERHTQAKSCLMSFLDHNIRLYTSSDIISTISYFLQKKLDLEGCVRNIEFIVQEVTVLSADNSDFVALNNSMMQTLKEHHLKIDYEDCMQLYLADKNRCGYILTSDNHFCQAIKKQFSVKVISLDYCIDYFS